MSAKSSSSCCRRGLHHSRRGRRLAACVLVAAAAMLATLPESCQAADLTSPGGGGTAPSARSQGPTAAPSPPRPTSLPSAVGRPTLRPSLSRISTSADPTVSPTEDVAAPATPPPEATTLLPTPIPVAWPPRSEPASNASANAAAAEGGDEQGGNGWSSSSGALRAAGIGLLLLTVEAYVLLLWLARKRRRAYTDAAAKAVWEVRRDPTHSTDDDNDRSGAASPRDGLFPSGGDEGVYNDDDSASRVTYSLDGMQSLYSFRRGGEAPPASLAAGTAADLHGVPDAVLVGPRDGGGGSGPRDHHPPVPKSIMLFI